MRDFFKYLTSGTEDKKWGIYMTVAGRYTALPGIEYPRKDHPSGYYFSWESWRILNEFQINYITEGQGILETKAGYFPVSPGSIMLICPGERHRYKPDINTGWTENYIGFSGELASHFVSNVFNSYNQPIYQCDNHFELIDSFQKIFDTVIKQRPSYQKVSSGLILKLIGYVESQILSRQFKGKEVEIIVNDAKKTMWENVDEEIDFKEFSRKHHVSYSYFRKVFKIYTGIAPHQYFLDYKIMRARELILASDVPVKEISYKLGFSSIQYFSRLFKKKTGMSPTDLRNNMLIG